MTVTKKDETFLRDAGIAVPCDAELNAQLRMDLEASERELASVKRVHNAMYEAYSQLDAKCVKLLRFKRRVTVAAWCVGAGVCFWWWVIRF